MERDLRIYGNHWGEHPARFAKAPASTAKRGESARRAEALLSMPEKDRRLNAVPTEKPVTCQRKDKHKDFEEITIKFVEHALGEGAHEKVPERSLDITLTYLLSPTDITLKKTGEIFDGITSERARQIRNQTMYNLWKNSLVSIQTQFPWEDLKLNLNKPKGMDTRPLFKKKQLPDELRNEIDDEKKQKFLNLVTRAMYHKFVKGDNPILIPIQTLTAESGYHIRTSEEHLLVRNTIMTVVPVGEIPARRTTGKIYSYHFILAVDKDKAKEALYNNKDLDPFLKNPVVQILGPKENQLPSTALLKSFGRFNKLLSKFEINTRKQKRKFIEWLMAQNDCPVPVYDHHKGLYYCLSQESDLQNYIANKMHEMVLATA